jgi:hypothetical protein
LGRATQAGERTRLANVTKPPGIGKVEIISPRHIYRFSASLASTSRTKTAYGTGAITKTDSHKETGPEKYSIVPGCKNKLDDIAEPFENQSTPDFKTPDTKGHHLYMARAKFLI